MATAFRNKVNVPGFTYDPENLETLFVEDIQQIEQAVNNLENKENFKIQDIQYFQEHSLVRDGSVIFYVDVDADATLNEIDAGDEGDVVYLQCIGNRSLYLNGTASHFPGNLQLLGENDTRVLAPGDPMIKFIYRVPYNVWIQTN